MPSAAILPASLAIPRPSNRCLSSSTVLTGPSHFRPFPISSSFAAAGGLLSPAIIRMGGGPRTFPGGVSKWQWKRMQAKKAKQLLKARLCRERQIYEMRKRAELKAAISELERPWEVVERAPTLFSASADEQVKVLADRFQRPGGFDMWSERDGPQLFRSADDLPSARFFPKGAVHSVKPYGVIAGDASNVGDGSGEEDMRYDDWIARGVGGRGRGRRARRLLSHSRSVVRAGLNSGEGGEVDCGSDSEYVVASSTEEGHEMAGGLIRPGGRGRGGNHDSYELELVGSGSRDGGEMAGSFNSRGSGGRLNQHRGGGHVRYQGHGSHGRGGNRGSYGLDAEVVVAGSSEGRDEMAGGLIRRGGGGRGRGENHDSYELELVGAGSRDGGEMAGSFNRRGGGGRLNQHRRGGHVRYQGQGSHGRGGNRGSYGLDAEDMGAGSRDGREMAGNFDRRSRLDPHRDSLNRRGGGGRFNQHPGGGQVRYQGRGGNHGSYGLDAGSSDEGDEMADGLIRRGGGRGRGKNHDSYELELVGAGSREGGEMDDSFDRRSRLDPHRGSLNRRGGSGRFNQHRGGGHIGYQGHGSHGRGGNRGSYGMDAEVVVGGSSEEGDEMAGGLNYRHGSNLDQRGRSSLNWRGDDSFNRGGGSFDRRGGRGRGRGQGVRRTGSVLLRPTTELNLEKGGRGRSGPKWRDGRSDGFSANRSGRRP